MSIKFASECFSLNNLKTRLLVYQNHKLLSNARNIPDREVRGSATCFFSQLSGSSKNESWSGMSQSCLAYAHRFLSRFSILSTRHSSQEKNDATLLLRNWTSDLALEISNLFRAAWRWLLRSQRHQNMNFYGSTSREHIRGCQNNTTGRSGLDHRKA